MRRRRRLHPTLEEIEDCLILQGLEFGKIGGIHSEETASIILYLKREEMHQEMGEGQTSRTPRTWHSFLMWWWALNALMKVNLQRGQQNTARSEYLQLVYIKRASNGMLQCLSIPRVSQKEA